MSITVTPSSQSCGAEVSGIDLASDLDDDAIASIRSAWLTHKVLSFPDQDFQPGDLEQFTHRFGPPGDDPFISAIEGRPHVIALHRAAKETASIFADSWHSDWSFQAFPPDGTCLYGLTIPPVGGNTQFADQAASFAEMPQELRDRIEGKTAIHSARAGYAPDGLYGEKDEGRATRIIYDDRAKDIQSHPLIRTHSETGQRSVFGCLGYIIGIEGLTTEESSQLLIDLYSWQTRDEFIYTHQWQPGMLVMWDNRSLLHRAQGGYDGHERLLHRTTIGHNPAFA